MGSTISRTSPREPITSWKRSPGGFAVTMLAVGTIVPPNPPGGTGTPSGSAVPGTSANQFSGVVLTAGAEGVNYNFGEVPTSITKRMFLAASTSQQEIYADLLGVTSVTVAHPATSDTLSAAISNQLVTVTTTTSGGTSTTQSIPTSTANVVLIDASSTNQPVAITDNRTNVLASAAATNVASRRAGVPVTQDSGVEVVNASAVTLNAVKGNNGLAVMYDSPGSDQLTAGNGTAAGANTATLQNQNPNLSVAATDFDTVRAISSAGGTDTATQKPPIDYLLELYGNWSP